MFLEFTEQKTFAETFWIVKNKRRKQFLGKIEYEPAWDDYTFNPEPNTAFSHECLTEIITFMKRNKKP